jgi:diadenosine tetraphosphatase ApaH/serine/threonine PP2A family protein phosphatase
MATIVIGDVHGHLPPLVELLDRVRPQVVEGDVVVFLGDYIDRGSDSRGCIDAILSFQDETPAEVVCLRGNHEDWLLRTQKDFTRHSWLLGMEGLSTVRSYSADADRILREALAERGLQLYIGRCSLPYEAFFDALPSSHRAFLSALTLCFESQDCICTHAGLDPQVAHLQDQPASTLVWGHASFPDAYRGAQTVVYGHWNNAVVDEQGWPTPRIVGNTIGIDTISHGVLTAIRMPDRTIIQSSRHGIEPDV